MVAIHLAPSLCEYCQSIAELSVSASTVRAALMRLENEHPSVYNSVCDETGAVRRHVNLFINSTLILVRDPVGLNATLEPGDVLTIWPAVSGG